ncbi:MAG: hypothetical protein JRG80_10105 [Deltaproteobacteria bacterium]|nr:hypothetical protein [Deltaproteobacteria bacterium]MBW2399615.1 hypothetical protein [Deltaproteobacteria bacterium]
MASLPDDYQHTWGDFAYDAVYAGAIGGSIVALFFLALDTLLGRPLFTPSLMGTVLFQGATASEVTRVSLDMVGLYSLVHISSFGILGCLVAFAVRETELHSKNPFGVMLGLFAFFEWGFFITTLVAMPGVMAVLGIARVALANLLAAGGIALFLTKQHDPQTWKLVKDVLHLA